MNRSTCGWLVALIALVVALPCLGQTSDVYQVSLSGSIVDFDDEVDPPALLKNKADTDGIINIARDRAPEADVPANEVLALLVRRDDDPDLRLVVWDTGTHAILETIADQDEALGGDTGKKGVFVALLDVNNTGGVNYGFRDGFLALSGGFTLDAQGRPAGFKAAVVGALELQFEGEVEDSMLTKGKLGAGKVAIDLLVE